MLRVIVAALLVCGAAADVSQCSTDPPLIPEYLTVHKVVGDWEEAELQCKSEGAVIASPINTELLSVMKCLIGVNDTPYLIGTRSRDNPRSLVSMEGVRLERMGTAVLAMIQKLEPQDGGCLSLDRRSIRVVPCWSRLPFMCYRVQHAHANVTSETTQSGSSSRDVTTILANADVQVLSCKVQGYKFNMTLGSCYKLHTELKTWDEAASTCVAESAHLVVLDDESEARFVASMDIKLEYPYTYIGIRGDTQNKWTSVTGKPVADIYKNWRSGYPTISGIACGVILSSGQIDDYSCTHKTTFICEKSLEIE